MMENISGTPAGWNNQLRQRSIWVGMAGVIVLLVVLPLPHLTMVRSIGLLATVLAGGVVCATNPNKNKWPLLPALTLWLMAALCSLFAVVDPFSGLGLIWGEVGKSILVFYACYVLASARPKVKPWFYAGGASLAALAGISITSWWWHGTWQTVGLVPPLGDYTTSALTLLPLVALPLVAPLRADTGPMSLPFSLLAMSLALVAGVLSKSRGFWLILLIMVVVAMLPQLWRSAKNRWGFAFWLTFPVAALMVIAYIVAQWRGMSLLQFKERNAIYGPVFKHLMDAPWYGFGYGHETMKEWYIQHMTEFGVTHAHNFVLSYAEQMGLPGVVALLALFGGLAYRFCRSLSVPNKRHSALAAFGMALTVGLFVRNNLDIFFVRQNLLLFFIVAGLMLGMLASNESENG